MLSKMIVGDDGRTYHIKLNEEDVKGTQFAILPGDPGRVPKIAAFLDNPRKLGENREYVSYEGFLDGVKVICVLPAGTPNCAEITGSAGRYISIDSGINMASRPRIKTIANDECCRVVTTGS